jgi:hypothetical protein
MQWRRTHALLAQRIGRRAAIRAVQGGVAASALLAFAPGRVAADSDPSLAIVGSWLIRSGPAGGPLPITSLITYTAHGACIQTTVSHPSRSAAMGVWTHLGGGEFAVTFEAFIFGPDGHFTNVSQVRVQSVMDDSLDQYTGRFQSYTLGDDGTPIRMDSSGQVLARRIQLARLDAPDTAHEDVEQ